MFSFALLFGVRCVCVRQVSRIFRLQSSLLQNSRLELYPKLMPLSNSKNKKRRKKKLARSAASDDLFNTTFKPWINSTCYWKLERNHILWSFFFFKSSVSLLMHGSDAKNDMNIIWSYAFSIKISYFNLFPSTWKFFCMETDDEMNEKHRNISKLYLYWMNVQPKH